MTVGENNVKGSIVETITQGRPGWLCGLQGDRRRAKDTLQKSLLLVEVKSNEEGVKSG